MVSSTLARELNRARVLKTLYAHGPLPRPELARRTGSTRATIGQIVQPLLDQGLLEEQDPLASGSQGGKPPRPIWFSSEGWSVGALLLLSDGAQAALVTASGAVSASATVKFTPKKSNHEAIIAQLAEALDAVIRSAAAPVRGIGVAVGGMVDTQTGGIVRFDLAPGLNGLLIGPMLERTLGVPTFVDNQPRAQALGDLLFGPGRGEDSFCSVYVGEGIGAGFIFEGVLHRGPRGAGGEMGHSTVDRDGPECRCGLRGCWEAVASTRWLRSEATRRSLPNPRAITTNRLRELASRNPAAGALLDQYATNIALGLANLQQTLGFGLFVVHGEPAGGGEPLRCAVENLVRSRAFPHPGNPIRVVFADTDDYATVSGAAGIVLSRSLHIPF